MPSDFVQLHLLTAYPPSNLNRDDLGRPKTAVMGGAQRLRVSSQSLKRAWRTSDVFQEALRGHIGTRTKEVGVNVLGQLKTGGVSEKDARTWAGSIAEAFGKLQKDGVSIEQLAHFTPEELAAVEALVKTLVARGSKPTDEELRLLSREHSAVDVALFGRMLAAKPAFNVEAAAQVAHALSVHEVAIEDDYFTAVDDLNDRQEGLGAGHVGEAQFASGLFYMYVCVNRSLLVDNLGGDTMLAWKALRALAEAALKVSPRGKQATFASRCWAAYALAEKGQQQPRSLAVAFFKPVSGKSQLEAAIDALKETRANVDKVYGAAADSRAEIDVQRGTGTIAEFLDFVSGDGAQRV